MVELFSSMLEALALLSNNGGGGSVSRVFRRQRMTGDLVATVGWLVVHSMLGVQVSFLCSMDLN